MTNRVSTDTSPKRPVVRIVLGIFLIVLAALAFIPSPFVIERPGPVVNALGTIKTESGTAPVIAIPEAQTYPSEAEMQILSVNSRGTPERPLSWLSALPGFFDSTQTLIPMKEVYPDQVDSEARKAANTALMQSSQAQAAAAALLYLDEPVATELTVVQVSETGPAAGVLEAGDVILDVNGMPVSSVAALKDVVQTVPSDTEAVLSVVREGALREVSVVPVRGEPGQPILLGISAANFVEIPFDIDVEVDRIGGPSAGLTFALSFVELLSPQEILGEHVYSATGTIDADGNVGPIGGLPQKMWAADRAGSELMLIPVANCASVPKNRPSGLPVVAVSSLDEAIDRIADFRQNGGSPGITGCE